MTRFTTRARLRSRVPVERAAAQIRRDVVAQTAIAGSGHPGGALGIADLLAVLYFRVLRHDSSDPQWGDRDRFVLSNGHCCAGLYSALARTGYFSPTELVTFRSVDSRLQGHPARLDLPGVETSAGPLGQGLSVAVGITMALRLRASDARVYCLLGDGELQEGQVWEAAMTAAHHRLDHLCAVISENGLQIDGSTDLVKSVSPVENRFAAFGWNSHVIDGHDINAICDAAGRFRETEGCPTAIIAKTTMGKGVSFMEGQAKWHGKPPSAEEASMALRELPEGFAPDLWRERGP